MNEFILLNKPKGMTSHDVVYRVRRALTRQGHGRVKVGHGGTLDPNATGLLVIGVGRDATRKLGEISKNRKKTYIAEITFGEERDTDDVEGRMSLSSSLRPSEKDVKKVLQNFVGKQEQTPPQYSAVKKGGRKAYELARRGRKVELAARDVEVFKAKFLDYIYPVLKVEFEVSSGTYIRSLARDIGRALRCAAYLSNLVRTRVGEYDLKDAMSIEDFQLSFPRKRESIERGDSGSSPE